MSIDNRVFREGVLLMKSRSLNGMSPLLANNAANLTGLLAQRSELGWQQA
jgi:hypothetical protein